jgi:hypothetical protein
MEAKPIAGKPGQPGSFPQASSCTACESPTGTFVGPMCADPAVPNKLYVGTDAGLVVGTAKNFIGNIWYDWEWESDPDIPDTWVTAVITNRAYTNQGEFGEAVYGNVYVSTFGRGVFRQVERTRGFLGLIICYQQQALACMCIVQQIL